MNYRIFILALFFVLVDNNSQAQKVHANTISDTFVKLTGEIKVIDSQYLLILKLSVSGNEKISIDKVRYFDQGEYSISPNRLSLKKIVRSTAVNIYVSSLKQPLYNEDWDKKIIVTKQASILDTVNLGNYYPFEIGDYLISVENDYWIKSVKHSVTVTDIPFTVSFLPKTPPFN